MSKEFDNNEYIKSVNKWALENPESVFGKGKDFEEARRNISQDTWKTIVRNLIQSELKTNGVNQSLGGVRIKMTPQLKSKLDLIPTKYKSSIVNRLYSRDADILTKAATTGVIGAASITSLLPSVANGAASTIGSIAKNPIHFASSTIGSIAGEKAVNKIIDKATNGDKKSWGKLIESKTNIPSDIAQFTNPGSIIGGVSGFASANKIKHVIGGWNAPKNTYRYIRNHLSSGEVTIPDYIKNKLDFSKIKSSDWYKDMVKNYGEKRADYIVKNIQKNEFKDFYLSPSNGYNPDKEMAVYNKSREIYSKLGGDPNKGKGVLGGSAGIMNEGTISRPSAAPHDLDFRSYIGNAKKTNPKLENTYTREDLSPLFNDSNLRKSPIIKTLREAYPESFSNASVIKFNKILPKWVVPNNKNGQIYITPMLNQGTPGASRTLMTQVDGVPVDFFISDNKIYGKKISTASETLYWKDLWNRRRGIPREKDVKDINNFKPFSRKNPVIDVNKNKSQYAPFHFSDEIISKEGYPIIHKVETYPGSKNFVPAIMNWKGEFKSPTTSNWIDGKFYKDGGKINK